MLICENIRNDVELLEEFMKLKKRFLATALVLSVIINTLPMSFATQNSDTANSELGKAEQNIGDENGDTAMPTPTPENTADVATPMSENNHETEIPTPSASPHGDAVLSSIVDDTVSTLLKGDSCTLDGIEFDEVLDASIITISANGNYYLTADIVLESSLIITGGATVNLCLNGHTITANHDNAVITIQSGATLNLYDNASDSGKITHITGKKGSGVSNFGIFNMHGGTITGNEAEKGGGVFNELIFNMHGGTIVGNKATRFGGGVMNNYNPAPDYSFRNIVTISGGTITGNEAKNGGGLHNDGIFNMEGIAEISNNIAVDGGGILNEGNFNMDGGTIKNNTATEDGGGVGNNNNFIMQGTAKITSNTATGNGGGVHVVGKFTMNGGAITGNTAGEGGGVYVIDNGYIIINGDINISANVKGGKVENGVLIGGVANNVALNGRNYIDVVGTLSETSQIYITSRKKPSAHISDYVVVASGEMGYELTASDTEKLISDDDAFVIEHQDGEAVIKLVNTLERVNQIDFVYSNGTVNPTISYTSGVATGSENIVEYKLTTAGDETYTTVAPTNVGNYTVRVSSVGSIYATDKVVTNTFSITKLQTTFENGIILNNADKTYTYGESISASVKVAHINVQQINGVSLFNTAPTENQVALFVRTSINGSVTDTQITQPQTVTDEILNFTIDTTNKLLKIGENQIIAKYVGDNNIEDSKASVNLIINKAPLTLTIENLNVYKGEYVGLSIPFVFEYEGFVNNENESVLETATAKPIVSANTNTNTAGIFDITLIIPNDSDYNYEITIKTGTLTVVDRQIGTYPEQEAIPDNIESEELLVAAPDSTQYKNSLGEVVTPDTANIRIAITKELTPEDKQALANSLQGVVMGDLQMALEISMFENDVEIYPSGDVEIFIPYSQISPVSKQTVLKIRHIKSDGTYEDITPTMLTNGIRFTANGLSPFVLYTDRTQVDSNSTNTDGEVKSPVTGENISVPLTMLFALSTIVLCSQFTIGKKKNKSI